MKKLIFILALSLTTIGTYAFTGVERTDDVKKVSDYAIKQFKQDFASAKDVSWKLTRDYIKANFSLDGKKMAALYDLQGTYLGAVEYLSYEQVPVRARTQIEKQYKNYYFSSGLKVVSRPYGSDFNDVGTYWVNLSSTIKELFISVSPSSEIALHKSTLKETTAKN
jgi:hypothetical protein